MDPLSGAFVSPDSLERNQRWHACITGYICYTPLAPRHAMSLPLHGAITNVHAAAMCPMHHSHNEDLPAVQLVVYCSLLGMGLYALHDQPWLRDSSYFWRDWPRHAPP